MGAGGHAALECQDKAAVVGHIGTEGGALQVDDHAVDSISSGQDQILQCTAILSGMSTMKPCWKNNTALPLTSSNAWHQ